MCGRSETLADAELANCGKKAARRQVFVGIIESQQKMPSGATAAGEEAQGGEACQAERNRLGNAGNVAKLKQVDLG